MKYSTKLTLLLATLLLLTNGILLSVIYSHSSKILFEQIQSKVLSIAATTAALVNGEPHKDLKTRVDETSESYKILEDQLRLARDANRRDDVHVSYIYTVTFAPENPDVVMFGVDPEESLENKSHIGDVYKGEYEEKYEMDKNQVDNTFSKDQWGVWLSANSPLKDKEGKTVAALGVDISASEVQKSMNNLLNKGLIALSISLIIGLAFSLLISKWVSTPLHALKKTVNEIGRGDLTARVKVETNDEFGEVAGAINSMAKGLQEREKLKSLFTRYVSQQVAENLLKSGEAVALKGHRRKITVLFSDIRDFTKMSENMPPEEVVTLLNEYFAKMIEVVFKNNGTLDKFMGDGLMVVFGAPVEDPYQEENAVKTALEMKKELSILRDKWDAERHKKLRIGIGINSGNAIVGNIGSSQRVEYTAIGDTVNLASRLESSTKEMDTEILLSEYTYNSVRNIFKTENLGPIFVKGRSDPVTVYAVSGFKEEPVSSKKLIEGNVNKLSDRPYFFDKGIRFQCQKCGACCTGDPGTVYVNGEEITNIATFMMVPESNFIDKYLYPFRDSYSIREHSDGRCLFYENGCKIYPVRPSQCSSFPFWFKNLRSEKEWEKTSNDCMGIGKGDPYEKKKILDIAQSTFFEDPNRT